MLDGKRWMEGFPFCSILWSNPLGSLFLCSDLGRLLKIMHETKSSRSRCLLNNRCCDQNVYFYLSAVSAITCLSFYFVELRVVDTSFSEHKSAYGFLPLFLAWEELAYYEENTRDFLFPVPRLTPSNPGLCREVLMKTVEGFPVSDLCPAGLLLGEGFSGPEHFIPDRTSLWADHFILVSAPDVLFSSPD